MKTPQDFRRDDVRDVFARRLGENIVTLKPTLLRVEENLLSDKTIVDICFQKIEDKTTVEYNFNEVLGSGFLDAIYKVCYNTFMKDYPSLKNISLVDLVVKPIFSMSLSEAQTDAKADVYLRLRTKQHGISEFSSRSRSIIYSSLTSMLDAFQFYMNCDKTFKVLQLVLDDARSRNRGDIMQQCRAELSVLTRVNTYD